MQHLYDLDSALLLVNLYVFDLILPTVKFFLFKNYLLTTYKVSSFVLWDVLGNISWKYGAVAKVTLMYEI